MSRLRSGEPARRITASPERKLYESIIAWRRSDIDAAIPAFSDLARRRDLDYAPLAFLALGEIAFGRQKFRDAISALESFGSMYMGSARGFAIGVPPPELYRLAFASYLRSAAYPRSLYLIATAHERLGQRAQARKKLEHLLALWKRADPDLRLLADAKDRLRGMRRR
jgi:tetratricopeptide (TPR) repeat protein